MTPKNSQLIEKSIAAELDKVSMEGILILKDEKPIFIDPRLESITGYSLADLDQGSLIGGVSKFIYPEDQEIAYILLVNKGNKKRKSVIRKQVRIITKSGDQKWLEVISNARVVDNSHFNQIVFIDITQQKKIEDQLRWWKEVYSKVAESSTNGIVMSDTSHQLVYVNKEFATLVGKPVSKIVNSTCWDDFVTPECRGNIEKSIETGKFKKTKTSTAIYCDLIDKNGQKRPCLATISLIKNSDKLIMSFIDLTEEKLAQAEIRTLEKKFETAFNTAPIGILLVNRNGTIDQVNKTFALIAKNRGNIVGMNFNQFVDEYGLPKQLKTTSLYPKKKYFKEIEITSITNERFYFTITATWINKSLGNDGYWMVMVENVSSQVKLNRLSSEITNKIIEAHEEEKQRLSQEIHDTISQSLAALKIDIQQFVKKTDPISEAGIQIVQRMTEIIETTRHLAYDLRPDLLDNLGLIEAVRHFALELSKRNSITLKIFINVEHADFGDHINLQLFRIIQEALTNTVKHGRANQVTLLIFKNKHCYTFLIRDNGVGFNVDTLTDTLPSNHLGMRIMRERSKDIGAELEISSQEKVGTIVKIRICSNL